MAKRVQQVLLVEDDRAVSSMLSEYLQIVGIRTISAFTVAEAERGLAEHSVDAILVDACLERDFDGVQFLRSVRPQFSGPIIGISGSPDGNSALCRSGATMSFPKTSCMAIIGALVCP